MKEPLLTPDAKSFMHSMLRRYDQQRRSKAKKWWLGFAAANLTALGGVVFSVFWVLPSYVNDEVVKRAGQEAKGAALQYVEDAKESFDDQWKKASDSVSVSLQTQVDSVSEASARAHRQFGKVECELKYATKEIAEITKLTTGFEGDAGRELLKRIKSVGESIKTQSDIERVLKLSENLKSLEESVAAQQDGLKRIAAKQDRLDRKLRHKAPASEVRFVGVEPNAPTLIPAPGGENISEWNIVVIPIAIGGRPALTQGIAGDLTDYKAGESEVGLLDQLRCYAQPYDETHWRIYAKQILFAGLGEDLYGLDVCCLMVRKEVVLGNED